MDEYTSTSEPQRIPCHSDFTINYRASFRGTSLPLERLPFVLRIQSWGAKTYVASHNPETNEWINCGPGATADYIRVFMHEHGLLAGELHGELHVRVADSSYPGGSRNLCYKTCLGVELTDECCGGYCCDVDVEVVLPYAVVTAYDIAAAAGYTGTREEYLAMLAGLPEDERARIEAEAGRINAESGRVAAEQARAEAETGRDLAEQARVEAEKRRSAELQGFVNFGRLDYDTTAKGVQRTYAAADAGYDILDSIYNACERCAGIHGTLQLDVRQPDTASETIHQIFTVFPYDYGGKDGHTGNPSMRFYLCATDTSNTNIRLRFVRWYISRFSTGDSYSTGTSAFHEINIPTDGGPLHLDISSLIPVDDVNAGDGSRPVMARAVADALRAVEDALRAWATPQTWSAVPEAYKGDMDVTDVVIPLDTRAGESHSVASVMDGCGNARTAVIGTNAAAGVEVSDATRAFFGCRKLREIRPALRNLDVSEGRSTLAFYGCDSLEEVRLPGVHGDIDLRWSPRLSYDSLKSIIEGHDPGTPSLLTVHPDVYAKLTGDSRERPEGWWTLLPTMPLYYLTLCDTPLYVYCLSGNSVVVYDKDAATSHSLVAGRELSDGPITMLRYDYQRSLLYVCHEGGSLDIVAGNGGIVQITAINESSGAHINDVDTDAEGRLYVATAAGWSVLSPDTYAIEGEYAAAAPVTRLHLRGRGGVMYRSADKIYTQTDTVSEPVVWTAPGTVYDWAELADGTLLYAGNGEVCRGTIDEDGHTITGIRIAALQGCGNKTVVRRAETGWYVSGARGVALIDEEGAGAYTALPYGPLDNYWQSSTQYGAWKGLAAVWGAGIAGLGCYKVEDGNVSVTVPQTAPPDASRVQGVTLFAPYPGGERVIMQCPLMRSGSGGPMGTAPINNVVPQDVFEWAGRRFGPSRANTHLYATLNCVVVDPVDPRYIYATVNMDPGLVVFKDGEYWAQFTYENSPFDKTWAHRAGGLAFDGLGNLWAHDRRGDSQDCAALILPADKMEVMRSAPDRLTKDDWIVVNGLNGSDSTGNRLLVPAKTARRVWSFYDFSWYINMLELADDLREPVKVHKFQYFRTQDKASDELFASGLTAVEDHCGDIWIPLRNRGDYDRPWMGVVIVRARDQQSTPYLNVIRPKLEGGGDLLQGIQVNGIAVDVDNTKWLSTETHGVYHVNADGTEILAHYDTNNTPLKSDQTWGICCNPNAEELFVSTAGGNYIYRPSYGGILTADEAARWEALVALAAQRNITITTL